MEKIVMWKHYKLKTPIVQEGKTFTELAIHPSMRAERQIEIFAECGNTVHCRKFYSGNLKDCREKVKELAVII